MTLQELEEKLLAMAYSGENSPAAENAFLIVYREYSKYLTAVVRCVTGKIGISDTELIHDIVEDTFLKIYQNPLIFDIPASATDDKCFKGWISKVARNELLRKLKDSSSGISVIDDLENEPAFDESESLPEELSINRVHLGKALATLYERDREILNESF